ASLSNMLLGPVRDQLDKKRLLIVPDGALQYLPFGALSVSITETAPQRSRAARAQVPLIVEHEIVSLPSASTLAVLRHEARGRAPASKMVAVLADPVFTADDPRVEPGLTSAEKPAVSVGRSISQSGSPQLSLPAKPDLERAAQEAGIVRFDRLPFSRR